MSAGRFTVENFVDIIEIARQIKKQERRLLGKDSFCFFFLFVFLRPFAYPKKVFFLLFSFVFHSLDVHVKRLRAKIEPDPTAPRYLITVRGLGYKLEA